MGKSGNRIPMDEGKLRFQDEDQIPPMRRFCQYAGPVRRRRSGPYRATIACRPRPIGSTKHRTRRPDPRVLMRRHGRRSSDGRLKRGAESKSDSLSVSADEYMMSADRSELSGNTTSCVSLDRQGHGRVLADGWPRASLPRNEDVDLLSSSPELTVARHRCLSRPNATRITAGDP